MTSEVIVMNGQGIAMAADTLGTVWEHAGKSHVRHSCQKLFQLGNNSTAGIMVNQRMTINSLPWQVMIQSYNTASGSKNLSHIEDCATDFINYTVKHVERYDTSIDNLVWHSDVLRAIEHLSKRITKQLKARIFENPETALKAAIKRLEVAEIADGGDDPTLIQHIEGAIETIPSEALQNAWHASWMSKAIERGLRRWIKLITVTDNNWLERSELVLGGCGHKDYFPSAIKLHITGYYLGWLKHSIGQAHSISQTNQAHILPYANRRSIHSFLRGIHPDIEHHGVNCLAEALGAIFDDHIKGYDRDTFIEHYLENYRTDMLGFIKGHRLEPLVDYIRHVSTPELARIATSLVDMTIINAEMRPERLGVGGYCTAAIISKGDGFKWVAPYIEQKVQQSSATQKY